MIKYNKQIGSVSLFIVIFATLLITVVTVSFVRVMVKDQQQANSNDLSQSAFDSAQAGVEDAKRVLLRYKNICENGSQNDCNKAKEEIASLVCNDAIRTLQEYASLAPNSEIPVKTSTSADLQQAYTCVKLNLSPTDYIDELQQDVSKMIPLMGESDFDQVKIEWTRQTDLGNSGSVNSLPPSASAQLLYANNSWPSNRPSILKLQLIQSPEKFKLTDLELEDVNKTMFLYPTQLIDNGSITNFPVRKAPTIAPTQASCVATIDSSGYACSATIKISTVKPGSHTTFINLKSIYKGSKFRLTLYKEGINESVKFKDVQYVVDSTGRANNVFRRVESRIILSNSNFPLPEAAVDVNKNFCKDFIVTDNDGDYVNSCNPDSDS